MKLKQVFFVESGLVLMRVKRRTVPQAHRPTSWQADLLGRPNTQDESNGITMNFCTFIFRV